MNAAQALAAHICDDWQGSEVHPFGYWLSVAGDQEPEVEALCARLAPIATLSPPGDGGWHDPGALTPSDLADLFAAGILAKEPRVEHGATYIEIAPEPVLRGLR